MSGKQLIKQHQVFLQYKCYSIIVIAKYDVSAVMHLVTQALNGYPLLISHPHVLNVTVDELFDEHWFNTNALYPFGSKKVKNKLQQSAQTGFLDGDRAHVYLGQFVLSVSFLCQGQSRGPNSEGGTDCPFND